MENKVDLLESLLLSSADHRKTSIELFKLKALDKTSIALSALVSRLIAFIFFFIFFLLVSFGIALRLGGLLGKSW
jgi:hypothetical protein